MTADNRSENAERSRRPPRESASPASDWAQTCDSFDRQWRSGRIPDIRQAINGNAASLAPEQRRNLLVELVMIDLAFRWRGTSAPDRQKPPNELLCARWRLRDYVSRFPELGPLERLPIELVVEEYRARRLAGQQPDMSHYVETFAVDGDQLRALLEAVDQSLIGLAATSASGENSGPDDSTDDAAAAGAAALTSADVNDSAPSMHACDSEIGETPGQRAGADEFDRFGCHSGMMLQHFRLEKLLGQGAFARVWQAYDTRLDRTVALKVPRRPQLTPDDMDAMLYEARAVAGLRHPGIATVHEIREHGDGSFIVSQLVDGQPLDKWSQGQSVAPGQAARIVAQIADALQAAHDAKVVHRDLKPSNILIDGDGLPHITDFGVALLESATTHDPNVSAIMGTPAYMAPEQARGEAHRADRRTDVFAVGIILYQLLTGERPFRGDVDHVMESILTEDPVAPRALNRRVPIDLSTICLKCLEKTPSRRYDTAANLAADLRRFLDGMPIKARPTGHTVRLARWCRRNWAVSTLLACVALLLLVVVISTTVGYVHTRRLLHEVEASAYLSKIAEAHRHWQENRVELLRQTLHECPPSFRNWEWGYLDAMAREPLVTLQPAGGEVFFAPDDQHLITVGGPQQDARLWDIESQKCLGRFSESFGRTGLCAVSADGRFVATTDILDGSIRIWDPETRRRIQRWHERTKSAIGIALSADAQKLWVFFDHAPQIVRWDVASQQRDRELTVSGTRVRCVALSPDAQLVAVSGRDNTARVIRIDNGEVACQWSTHTRNATSLAWRPDGRRIAGVLGDATLKIWDATNGRTLVTCADYASPTAELVFSHGGQWLASGGPNGTTRVWDTTNGQLVRVLRGHRARVIDMAFSSDDRFLAASARDNTVGVWNLQQDDGGTLVDIPRVSFAGLTFGTDNTLWAAAIDGCVYRLPRSTVNSPRSIPTHGTGITAFAVAPNNTLFVTANVQDGVRMWTTDGGEQVAKLDTGIANERVPPLLSLVFSADGRSVLGVGRSETLFVWDVLTRTCRRRLKLATDDHRAIAVSRDDRRVAVASRDGNVRILDFATGRLETTIHANDQPLWSCVFSPNGQTLAVGAADGSCSFWDVESWTPKFTLVNDSNRRRVRVAYAPAGDRFVTAVSGHNVKLWQANTGRLILTLYSSPRVTGAVAWSPDGSEIVAGLTDGGLLKWTSRNAPDSRLKH